MISPMRAGLTYGIQQALCELAFGLQGVRICREVLPCLYQGHHFRAEVHRVACS